MKTSRRKISNERKLCSLLQLQSALGTFKQFFQDAETERLRSRTEAMPSLLIPYGDGHIKAFVAPRYLSFRRQPIGKIILAEIAYGFHVREELGGDPRRVLIFNLSHRGTSRRWLAENFRLGDALPAFIGRQFKRARHPAAGKTFRAVRMGTPMISHGVTCAHFYFIQVVQ